MKEVDEVGRAVRVGGGNVEDPTEGSLRRTRTYDAYVNHTHQTFTLININTMNNTYRDDDTTTSLGRIRIDATAVVAFVSRARTRRSTLMIVRGKGRMFCRILNPHRCNET